jgi:hypothetical protein
VIWRQPIWHLSVNSTDCTHSSALILFLLCSLSRGLRKYLQSHRSAWLAWRHLLLALTDSVCALNVKRGVWSWCIPLSSSPIVVHSWQYAQETWNNSCATSSYLDFPAPIAFLWGRTKRHKR